MAPRSERGRKRAGENEPARARGPQSPRPQVSLPRNPIGRPTTHAAAARCCRFLALRCAGHATPKQPRLCDSCLAQEAHRQALVSQHCTVLLLPRRVSEPFAPGMRVGTSLAVVAERCTAPLVGRCSTSHRKGCGRDCLKTQIVPRPPATHTERCLSLKRACRAAEGAGMVAASSCVGWGRVRAVAEGCRRSSKKRRRLALKPRRETQLGATPRFDHLRAVWCVPAALHERRASGFGASQVAWRERLLTSPHARISCSPPT